MSLFNFCIVTPRSTWWNIEITEVTEMELPVPPHPGHQQAASSVLYTTSCKHSLVLLRMGEFIARNVLS